MILWELFTGVRCIFSIMLCPKGNIARFNVGGTPIEIITVGNMTSDLGPEFPRGPY